MKIISVRNVKTFAEKIRHKPSTQNRKIVESIISKVQKKGDFAVKYYEKKFSGASIRSLRVSRSEVLDAYSQVSKDEIAAIKLAKKRLAKTESAIKNKLQNITIKFDGIKISKSFIPIDSVGCYVPSGLARYPSSAIMSITPAKIAGVQKIVMVSPPNSKGLLDPLTLVAADICGVNEIFKTGGAQAIAALCFGTNSIPSVNKIVGPGGSFVTLAKIAVSDKTSIDMIAGPTELGIIADETANPEFVAIDLISQAEHSQDTFCYLITNSAKLAKDVKKTLDNKLKTLKRSKIIKQSFEKNGFIAICKNRTEMITLANYLAPEHLEIMTKNSTELVKKIKTPGLVLLGRNSPSSASDYLLGSNHILPTNGFGKVRGSLSVLDFMKLTTQVEATQSALRKISKPLKALTTAEELSNHYEAVRSRIE